MQIVIGPWEIGALILLAVGYLGFYLGVRHGKRLGFMLGAVTAEANINHVLGHCLGEEEQKNVQNAVRIYLADPKNIEHIKTGGGHAPGL